MVDEPEQAGPDRMRVAAAQIENVVGDLDGNARRILDAMRWAEQQEADVIVFPELALTGYPLADLVLREEFGEKAQATLERLARNSGSTAAIVGTIGAVPPRRSWDTRERDDGDQRRAAVRRPDARDLPQGAAAQLRGLRGGAQLRARRRPRPAVADRAGGRGRRDLRGPVVR